MFERFLCLLSCSFLLACASFSHASSNNMNGVASSTPPDLPYKKVMNVNPRYQWAYDGGYCGSISVQSIALSYGAWISQALVRKAAPNGGGHGNPEAGYEILHTNIEAALTKLKLTYAAWPFASVPVPQSSSYLSWLKNELVSGHPVVWFIMCSGDKHNSYGIAQYDHVEPVFGIYSSYPLTSSSSSSSSSSLTSSLSVTPSSSSSSSPVYPSDVLVHGSDWDLVSYYRRFDTLVDDPSKGNVLTGNCSKATPIGGGPNEAYPCVMDNIDYGYSISGLVDPLSRRIRISLSVSGGGREPYGSSTPLTATITVDADVALTEGAEYTIFRFDGTDSYPVDSNYEQANATTKFTFVYENNSKKQNQNEKQEKNGDDQDETTKGDDETGLYTWVDPTPIQSDSAVYYVLIKNENGDRPLSPDVIAVDGPSSSSSASASSSSSSTTSASSSSSSSSSSSFSLFSLLTSSSSSTALLISIACSVVIAVIAISIIIFSKLKLNRSSEQAQCKIQAVATRQMQKFHENIPDL